MIKIDNQMNSLPFRIIGYTLYLFFLFFPFTNPQSFLYGASSFRAILLIATTSILGLFLCITLFNKKKSLLLPKSPIFYIFGVYFISITISAIVGLSFPTSFWSLVTRMTGLWYFLNLGTLAYLLWLVFSDELKQRKLILLVVLTTVIYSVLSFLSPEGIGLLFKDYFGDAFTFGNSTFAGMYIFGAFLLSVYYLLQSVNKKWWMYCLPVLMVINPNILNNQIWFGNFSSGFVGEARASTYVILFSVIFLTFIWLVSKIKPLKIKVIVSYSLFGVAILGIIFSAISLFSQGGVLQKAYLNQATAARPLVWETSWKAVEQRPYFGWGTDNFERVFEINSDNRLLQNEYGNEAWFDRAHNVIVDQSVDNGFVGLFLYLLIYLVIIWSLIYTSLYSSIRNDRIFASILIVYFSLHFVELQTAFDTTISYPMLIFMAVSAALLFERVIYKDKENVLIVPSSLKYLISVTLFIFFSWSLVFGVIPFVRTQLANGYIRTVGSAEERIPVYKILFNSPIDKHAFIWRTSTDFQRGIAANTKVLEDPKKVEKLKEEIVIFENGYRDYVRNNPKNFRARLNLADVLIYQMLFQVNKLEEAQSVLDGAIALVPQSPQPYWMKAVAYVYMKKFDLAREYAQKGLALNPKIKQSQTIVDYVERSIKTFPEIDLYFFNQI